MMLVRDQMVSACTPDDRELLATAFVTPHAVTRFRQKIVDVHPFQAVQDITAGIRAHAVTVRDRGGHGHGRVDVTVETPTRRWVARVVANRDPSGSPLVVETILTHPDTWTRHPHPGGPGLWLTTLHLDRGEKWVRDAVGDMCTMHRRVLDLVENHPVRGDARVLWATPAPGLLVVRSTEPVTATPAGFTARVSHRRWTPPDRPGRWMMTAVVNPSQDSRSGGSDRRAGKGRGRSMRLHKTPEDVSSWLTRKLPGGTVSDLGILDARVDRGQRDGARITERKLRVAAVVDVHDPAQVAAAASSGLGRGKAWGCGLSLWEQRP